VRQVLASPSHLSRNPPARRLQHRVVVASASEQPVADRPCDLEVRAEKVRAFILWLKENNPLYKDIELDEEALQGLPSCGVPAELIDAAKESDMVAEHSAESAGIDNSRRVEPSEAHRHTERSTCA